MTVMREVVSRMGDCRSSIVVVAATIFVVPYLLVVAVMLGQR